MGHRGWVLLRCFVFRTVPVFWFHFIRFLKASMLTLDFHLRRSIDDGRAFRCQVATWKRGLDEKAETHDGLPSLPLDLILVQSL